MTNIRKSEERGSVNLGWLQSKHSFSFGSYYDPAHMGLSALRVINDDHVVGGAGFDTHSHADMEIISYVLEGALKHEDSMGNQFIVPAGEVQRMSAGTGITHSEYNASSDQAVKFLQIWIQPAQRGLTPGYEQARIPQAGALTPLVTPDGNNRSLRMNQDASIYRLQLGKGEGYRPDTTQRPAYLHVIEGDLKLDLGGDSHQLRAGDAISFSAYSQGISLKAESSAVSALWFDLPLVPTSE